MSRPPFSGRKYFHRICLVIEKVLGQRHRLADRYGNLGKCHQACGNLDVAEDMYQKSLEIGEAHQSMEAIAAAHANLGDLYHVRGSLDRAETMYLKSLELDTALGYKVGMASTCRSLGSIYESCGDLDGAEEMYLKSIELFGKLRRVYYMSEVEDLLYDLRKRR